jgi:serine/threonine protein phosphatase 1
MPFVLSNVEARARNTPFDTLRANGCAGACRKVGSVALNLPFRGRKGPPATAPGERLYAIGDVHGCYDLLMDLLDQIEAHAAALPPAKSEHIILMGDLVDRGPDSAKVLRFAHQQSDDDYLITLLGNHDDMLVRAWSGEPRAIHPWLRTGGAETVRSFGLELPPRDADEGAFVDALRAAVPAEWITWLRGCPLTVRSGDYFFCHAGIRPGVPLGRQTRYDLMWIRDGFIGDTQDHGVVVVHGHTISAHVELLPNRIGLDTGAYESGVLSAMYFEGTERHVFQARR